MMILLDHIPRFLDRFHRTKPVIREVIADTVKNVEDSVGTAKEAVADSTSQASLMLDGMGATQSDASLLMPLAAVTAALAGCLYLAHLYRRRLSNR